MKVTGSAVGARFDPPVEVPFRGAELLRQALLNKDAAFPEEERDGFRLRGLLPSGVVTIEQQVALELERLARKGDDLERYIGLAALHDRNETLFYRLLLERPDELLPIIYTPTVGRACQDFSHIVRRMRGVWITPEDTGRVPTLLRNTGLEDVRLIVCTDNERILGLGDQGCGGMGIAIGKLALYSAAAGIYPSLTLPVSLDVGTDNQALLADPQYMGYRRPRLRGAPYDAVVEAFVEGVRRVFPRAVIQWEDFKQQNAFRIHERYRRRIPSFNDDIQGTAAVVLAGILTGLRVTGETLPDQRIVFVGAGASGLGIARLIRLAMQRAGASTDQISRSIAMLDSKGLVFEGRLGVDEDKKEFALGPSEMGSFGFPAAERYDLAAVVAHVRPTILIGTSATPGTFTEAAVREMAAHVRTPIVMPLSNPTSQAEATPAEILAWTEGRALVATGSPFEAVVHPSRVRVGQANNVFIFPGLGLGLIVAEARAADDRMFLDAADALAALVSPGRLAEGALYPPLTELRRAARQIAVAVARRARDVGLGLRASGVEIEAAVDAAMWYPGYRPYRPA